MLPVYTRLEVERRTNGYLLLRWYIMLLLLHYDNDERQSKCWNVQPPSHRDRTRSIWVSAPHGKTKHNYLKTKFYSAREKLKIIYLHGLYCTRTHTLFMYIYIYIYRQVYNFQYHVCAAYNWKRAPWERVRNHRRPDLEFALIPIPLTRAYTYI